MPGCRRYSKPGWISVVVRRVPLRVHKGEQTRLDGHGRLLTPIRGWLTVAWAPSITAHLGRAPSYAERLLIGRLLAIEWELRRQDAKIEAGEELSGHALRARLAAENRLRLDLQALGLQPAAPRKLTSAEALALIHGRPLPGDDANAT